MSAVHHQASPRRTPWTATAGKKLQRRTTDDLRNCPAVLKAEEAFWRSWEARYAEEVSRG